MTCPADEKPAEAPKQSPAADAPVRAQWLVDEEAELDERFAERMEDEDA